MHNKTNQYSIKLKKKYKFTKITKITEITKYTKTTKIIKNILFTKTMKITR
jgi:hypothetical protein